MAAEYRQREKALRGNQTSIGLPNLKQVNRAGTLSFPSGYTPDIPLVTRWQILKIIQSLQFIAYILDLLNKRRPFRSGAGKVHYSNPNTIVLPARGPPVLQKKNVGRRNGSALKSLKFISGKIFYWFVSLLILLNVAGVYGQANQPVSVTARVNDAYTQQAIANALTIWQSNGQSDTLLTDHQGIAQYVITGISDQAGHSPSSFSLIRNYPNPFTDEIKIDMAVPQKQQIEYTLYNVLGQKIGRGNLTAPTPGLYQFQLKRLQGYARGIYFLQVKAGIESKIVKMVKLGSGNGFALPAVSLNKLSDFIPSGTVPSLKKIGGSLFQLTVTRVPYDTFRTTFSTPQQDTIIYVNLVRNNQVAIHAEDEQGNPVAHKWFVFTKNGARLDSILTDAAGNGQGVVKSDDYVIAMKADSLYKAFQQAVSVFSDTTLSLSVENQPPQKYLVQFAVVDTSEDNAPVAGKWLKIQQNGVTLDSVLTDTQGTARDSLEAGNYTLVMDEDILYDAIKHVFSVEGDTLAHFQTRSTKPVVFTVLYPDSTSVAGALVDVNGKTLTTDDKGKAQTREFNGNHPYTIYDDQGRIVSTNRVAVVHGATTLEDIVEEYISIGDFNFTTKEDSSVILDLGSVTYGTAEDTSYAIVTDPNASVEHLGGKLFKITPKPDFNGQIQFSVYAKAEHSTEKTEQFIGTFEPQRDVRFILENNDTDTSNLPGYVRLYDAQGNLLDSLFTETGTTQQVQLPDGDIKVEAGLVRADNHQQPWSYIRTITLPDNGGQDLGDVVIRIVDWYLRDLQNNQIVDSLYVEGVSPPSDSTKMAPWRFFNFFDWCHAVGSVGYLGPNGGGGEFNHTINRWNQSHDGFVADSLIIIDTTYFASNPNQIYNLEPFYPQQIKDAYGDWLKPLLDQEGRSVIVQEVPFRIRDPPFGYEKLNLIELGPRGDILVIAQARVYGDDNIPAFQYATIDLRSGGPNYAPADSIERLVGINQELWTAFFYSRGPPTNPSVEPRYARPEESIVHDNHPHNMPEPTVYDIKGARIILENSYNNGESIYLILKLPPGYEEPNN